MEADDVAAVCRRLGLRLEEVMPGRTGGSVFVARVRDGGGAACMLKRTSPDTGVQELAALRAWSPSGVTPRLIAEPEPGLYLAEWFVGVPLHRATDPATTATGVGRALRLMHGLAAPPAGSFATRATFAPGRRGWGRLDPPMQALRERLSTELLARHPDADVLLHGDLAPMNVLATEQGPRIIDPVGRRGLPAWDLAQLAAAAEGRGVRRLLPALLDGYGERPALVDEMAAYFVLDYLDRNLAAPWSPHTPHLLPLAEALLQTDDPARFAATHLS